MYLSFDLADGDIINISGRLGGVTVDLLPDRYIPMLSNSIIAGLVSNEYKDPDAYAIYSRKAEKSKLATRESIVQTKFTSAMGGYTNDCY
jgi:hypothetical protein